MCKSKQKYQEQTEIKIKKLQDQVSQLLSTKKGLKFKHGQGCVNAAKKEWNIRTA